MPSLIATIQDAERSPEIDARTVLRSAPEPVADESGPVVPEVLARFDAPAASRAADTYAQLLVQPIGDERFTLSVQHNNDAAVKQIGEPHNRPRISLGELASSRRAGGADFQPEKLYRLMLVWSQEMWTQETPELLDWLQQLRAMVGDDELRLVIWDTTGFDIPWELLLVPAGESPSHPAGLLGGLFAVSRRISGRQATGEAAQYADHVCRGRLLAYVEDEMAADRDFLPGYATSAVGNLDELLNQLETAEGTLGLVYVACHGRWAEEMSDLLLGNLHYTDIVPYPSPDPLPVLSRSRAVVFLNACHAARLLRDPRLKTGVGVYGFARAFMQGGAAVVIGPTGLVETGLAGRVAADILAQVARQPSQPLAAALAQVRAKIAQRVVGLRRPAEEDLKELIYTFMYVCYGNPYATLELTAGDGQ
jgi:CHAT domain